jgi:glycine cleavage system pyridoxal-binding protein P
MLRKIGKNSVEDLMKDIIPIDVLDNKSLEFG